MGNRRTEAAVDNERNETPGELNTGVRGSGEKKRETSKVSKLIRTPIAVRANNAAFFSNCALIIPTFSTAWESIIVIQDQLERSRHM